MVDLYNIKRELQSMYFSTQNTVERYNILKEMEEHIADLRKQTIESIVTPSDSEKIISVIQKLLAEFSGYALSTVQEYVTVGARLTDVIDKLNLDSLDIMEFIMSLEDEFDIEIYDEDLYLDKIKTISNIINLVHSKKK